LLLIEGQLAKPGFRTQIDPTEGGSDQGDAGHASSFFFLLSSFFLNQEGNTGGGAEATTTWTTPPRAEGEEKEVEATQRTRRGECTN